MKEAAVEFSRDYQDLGYQALIRFVNLYQLYYFLRTVRELHGLRVCSIDQLKRWISLMLKWPRLAVWIQQGGNGCDNGRLLNYRLIDLESLSKSLGQRREDQNKWEEEFLKLTSTKIPYSLVSDDALRQYFYIEGHRPDDERLSSAAGTGLY